MVSAGQAPPPAPPERRASVTLMVFAYYNRLTRAQKRIYDRSDGVITVHLPQAASLSPLIGEIAEALKREDRGKTEAASQQLVTALTDRLRVAPVHVEVLAKRPSRSWGELYGLYSPADGRTPVRVTVWMRTAHRRQVVAFRTFLRTLLHELCHHLDYELFDLKESFHTQGFYQRESNLFHQLVRDRDERPRVVKE